MDVGPSFGYTAPPLRTSQGSEDEGVLGEVTQLTLSQCLNSLFAEAHPPAPILEPLPDLNGNSLKISKPRVMREVFESEEVKAKRRAIQDKVLSSGLNPKEKFFCLQLIDTYLSIPGYKRYQSFIKALLTVSDPEIDLNKIGKCIEEIDKEIDQLKELCQATYRENKRILNVLVDSAIGTYTLLSTPSSETEGQPLLSLKTLSAKQIQNHVTAHQQALKVKDKILSHLPESWDQTNVLSKNEFIKQLINIFVFSSSKENFGERFNRLINEVNVSKELLGTILPLIGHYLEDIQLLVQNHQQFRAGYAHALENAQETFLKLEAAFCDEYEPAVSPETKLITVSFARFRVALTLFHRDFKWMLELASCTEEDALASRILAVILCGKKRAPTVKELSVRPCCFKIREFSDQKHPLLEKSIVLTEGTSFLLHHLNTHGDASEPEDPQFKKNMESAADLFVKDSIERGGIKVSVGKDPFITGVFGEEDLRKPFFLEVIIQKYVPFLKQDPSHVREAMDSPLFQLARRNYGRDILTQLFAGKGKDEVARQAIQKIFECLKDVPEHLHDLVILKLLEQFIMFNQFFPGNLCREICSWFETDLTKKCPSCSLFPKMAVEYSLSIEPPLCEAMSCNGVLPLCFLGGITNCFFRDMELISAELVYDCRVPSLTALDHAGMRNCPVISLSDLAFSPFATPNFFDSLGSQINQKFVEEQIWILSPAGISRAFSEIITNLENCDDLFDQLDGNEKETLGAFLTKFVTAFATDKKLDMLMFAQKLDVKTLRALKRSRGKLITCLENFFERLLSHYNDKPHSRKLQKFLATIIKWFPEINK